MSTVWWGGEPGRPVSPTPRPLAIIAAACAHLPSTAQLTTYLPVSQDQTLYHPVSGSCMDCSESDHRIFMNTCNPSSPTQQWLFEHTNSTVLEKFNSN